MNNITGVGRWLTLAKLVKPLLGRVPLGHLWFLTRRMRNENLHHWPDAGGRRQIRINSFFPPFPSRAFDRFIQAIVKRQRVPMSVYCAMTNECPERCSHCSLAGRRGEPLSTAQWLDVIAQAKTLGCATLGFTGGEPLLRDDLEPLVAAASDELATIVFTTGQGLTAQRAKRLREAGLTNLTVGLEYSEAKRHDAIRGQSGSFAQARRAIDLAKKAGLYTAISTIGTREKLASGEIERLYDLAARWDVAELRLLAPVATGAQVGCASFMLTPEEYRQLGDFHVTHNRRHAGPAVTSFAYLESQAQFGCGAGYHHLFIDHAGEVCPCDLTPLSMGNVNETPLAEIWDAMARLFAKPRVGCLMGELATRSQLDPNAPLPLPREQSIPLLKTLKPTDLPTGYQHLLRKNRTPSRPPPR